MSHLALKTVNVKKKPPPKHPSTDGHQRFSLFVNKGNATFHPSYYVNNIRFSSVISIGYQLNDPESGSS